MIKQLKKSPGFLTLEILLCLAFGAIAVSASLALIFTNQDAIINIQNRRLAQNKVKEIMELTLLENFKDQAEANGSFDFFEHSKDILLLADYAKLIKTDISWQNGNLKKTLDFFSLKTDWQNALGYDTCALVFSKDWALPNLQASLALGLDNPATGLDVRFNKIYLSANSSIQNRPDIFIIDFSNNLNPVLLTSLNTGPGLNAVHVAGDYAFAANTSLNSQLQIIKIINDQLTVMLNLKLPFGNDAVGKSIYFYNENVFIGTEKSSGPEFYVYDVENPLAPIFLGAFETNTAVNSIYVYNNRAYLALAQDKLFTILDVNDPTAIFEIGSLSPEGSNVQSAQSLAVLGTDIILGRAGGLPQLGYKEFIRLNSENLSLPVINSSLDLNASVRGLFLRDGLVFSAVNKAGEEFEVFSLNQNLQKISSANLPTPPSALDCEGEKIFIASENEPQLHILSPNN